MSETERPERRPPDPDAISDRQKAKGIGKAMQAQLPPDGNGLGRVGEAVIHSLIDDSEQEEEKYRLFMRFTPRWRAIIRWFSDEKLDDLQKIVLLLNEDRREALEALLDDYAERRVLRVFWRRIWASLLVIVPSVFGAAQYGFDRIPLIRSIIALVRGT